MSNVRRQISFYSAIIVLSISSGFTSYTEDRVPFGHICDTVYYSSNPSQSYALYVPSNYTPDSSWPVIFFFDPAARGSLPLQLYSSIAEMEGIILAASNQSRNYLPWNEIYQLADGMIQDIDFKFSIDSTRKYSCGFSGGSRVAARVALSKNLSGIIGCGAGFPMPFDIPDTVTNLVYTGIVGTQDMNYQEMVELESKLNAKELPTCMLSSRYGHSWAPDSLFRAAWFWQQLFYWKNEQLPEKEEQITKLLTEIGEEQQRLIKQGQILEGARRFNALKKYFANREELQPLSATIQSVTASKDYRKQFRQAKKLMIRENTIQDNIYQEMNQLRYIVNPGDSLERYWFNKINSFRRMQRSKNALKSDFAARQLNLFAILCAEYIQEIYKLPEAKQLLFFSKLWVQASPENPYAYWNIARAYALNKNENQALKNLQKSVNLGFDKREWLLEETAFFLYHDHAAFKSIIKSL